MSEITNTEKYKIYTDTVLNPKTCFIIQNKFEECNFCAIAIKLAGLMGTSVVDNKCTSNRCCLYDFSMDNSAIKRVHLISINNSFNEWEIVSYHQYIQKFLELIKTFERIE